MGGVGGSIRCYGEGVKGKHGEPPACSRRPSLPGRDRRALYGYPARRGAERRCATAWQAAMTSPASVRTVSA